MTPVRKFDLAHSIFWFLVGTVLAVHGHDRAAGLFLMTLATLWEIGIFVKGRAMPGKKDQKNE
jgi:hypothetical protein